MDEKIFDGKARVEISVIEFQGEAYSSITITDNKGDILLSTITQDRTALGEELYIKAALAYGNMGMYRLWTNKGFRPVKTLKLIKKGQNKGKFWAVFGNGKRQIITLNQLTFKG